MSKNLKLKYSALLLSSAVLLQVTNAIAAPTGGAFQAGTTGTIVQAVTTEVTTFSTNAIINWTSFSVPAGYTVNFYQPTNTSNVLNRVVGVGPASLIQGAINSTNGRVFLVNPNGIVFSSTATLNVGGLVASTLDITDSDFLTGKFSFTGTSTALVRNDATFVMPNGGKVFLIGKDVINGPTGDITANGGGVWLMAGGSATAINQGSPELSITYTAPAGQATNIGKLIAAGGTVGLLGNTVVAEGQLSANTVALDVGRIYLRAKSNLTVGTGASMTADAGVISIDSKEGNVLLDAGSTINAGTGIIGIKGASIDQSASAGTAVRAAHLGVYSTTGSIELDGPANYFGKLSAQMDSTTGAESMTIVDGFTAGLSLAVFDPTILRESGSGSTDLPVNGIQAGNNSVSIANTGSIKQATGAPIIAGALTLSSPDAIDLEYSGNSIGSLKVNAGGAIHIVDGSGGLTLSGTSSSTGIGAAGEILIKTAGGDLVLDASGSVQTSGDNTGTQGAAIVLAGDQGFVNKNIRDGANAVSAPNGRWLIYAGNPLTSTLNGITGDNLYGCSFDGCIPSSVSVPGNQLLWRSLSAAQQSISNHVIGTTTTELSSIRTQTDTETDPNRATEPEPTAASAPSNTGSNNVDKTPARNRFMCSA